MDNDTLTSPQQAGGLEVAEPRISSAYFREIFDADCDGIILIQADYRVLTANAAAMSVLGHTDELSLSGKTLSELGMLTGMRHKLEMARAQQSIERHVIRTKRSSESAWGVKIVWMDNAKLWTLTLQDISEECHAQDIRAELSDLLKQDLNSSMAILANTEQLTDMTDVSGVRHDTHEIIRTAVTHLRSTLEGIFQVSGSYHGRVSRSWAEVNLSELIDAKIRYLKKRFKHKNLTWNWLPAGLARTSISANAQLLERTLFELLNNAAKFSPQNGVIDVELCSGGELIQLSIEDHGPEIPEALYTKIFEDFTKSEAWSGQRESQTGLGWEFVHRVSLLHGGSVCAMRPRTGRGLRIVVRFPLHADHSQRDSSVFPGEQALPESIKPARQTPNQTNEEWQAQTLLKTQEQLTRSAKLSALGQMAGAIAHDMGNIISPIVGYTDLLLMTPGLPEKSKRYADRIKKASTRASEMLRGLTSFVVDRGSTHTPQNLGALMQNVLSFLAYNFNRKGIIPILTIEPELPLVLGNSGQLETAFVSLLMYARQSMQPKGGQLQISLQKSAAGTELKVEIESEGISPEAIAHLFEPLFNNSDLENGLELFICHQIVEQHGGTIDVESQPGKSTTFHVIFPSVGNKKAVVA